MLQISALTADGAGPDEVFDAVAAAAAALTPARGATVIRLDGERACTVVGRSDVTHPVGTRIVVGAHVIGLIGDIIRADQAAERDGRGVVGQLPAVHLGSTGVAIPLIVDHRVWGVLEITTGPDAPSPAAGRRLRHFAELVTGAVAAAHVRAELQSLVDERAALRRIHAVAGRGGTGADVMTAIAAEGSVWLDGLWTALVRVADDGSSVVVAACGRDLLPTESDQVPDLDLIAEVVRSATPTRSDDAGQKATGHRVQATLGVPILVAGRIWGVLVAGSNDRAVPPLAEHRLARFAEAITPTILSAQARTQLAEEQFALRRVAELVARGATAQDVFTLVVREASVLLQGAAVVLIRRQDADRLQVVAARGTTSPDVGTVLVGEDQRPPAGSTSDPDTSIAATIHLAGAWWGSLTATSAAGAFPPGTEHRLNQFADLASAALANAQARAEIQALADEQAALSRVAALVVRGAALTEVFTAVVAEASGLVEDTEAALVRCETDGGFVVVAAAYSKEPVEFRGVPNLGALLTDLIATGAPARTTSSENPPWADTARQLQIGPTIAVPITVETRLWGALTVSSWHRPLAKDVETRLLRFTELAGTAIANAENKAELTASRARVVATADETRRRLQRDVHNGAQQRLVHSILALKLARQSIAVGLSPAEFVDEALLNAERAGNELRDIVRGILPAALTRGGLRLGLESLLADIALPVDMHVTAPRCSTNAEQTAYFVVAEALTNVTRHAHAGRATVSVTLDGDTLVIEVHDDGIGGADPSRGTGLIGLTDRVDAVGGALTLSSPPDGGTTLLVRLPVQQPPASDR